LSSLFGAFIILHGLVHLLYFAQSQRIFELRPGMVWPDGSWAFSRLLGEKSTKLLASALCLLAALGFIAGGIGLFFGQAWWRNVSVAAAAISILLYILFWNGKLQKMDDQGGVGILIDIAILAVIVLFQWP
jgi:hypothetical protein